MYSSDLLVPGHLGLTETISPTLAAYIAHFLFLLALAIVSRLSASCEVELNALVSFDMCWCIRHFFHQSKLFFGGRGSGRAIIARASTSTS
jgi:hypothetical protein